MQLLPRLHATRDKKIYENKQYGVVTSAPYVRLNHVSLSLNTCYAIIWYEVSWKLREM